MFLPFKLISLWKLRSSNSQNIPQEISLSIHYLSLFVMFYWTNPPPSSTLTGRERRKEKTSTTFVVLLRWLALAFTIFSFAQFCPKVLKFCWESESEFCDKILPGNFVRRYLVLTLVSTMFATKSESGVGKIASYIISHRLLCFLGRYSSIKYCIAKSLNFDD